MEGIPVLAWSIGTCAFPGHDQQADPHAVTDSVGFLSDDAAEWAATARLAHDDEAIYACREVLYAIHCRLRQFVHFDPRPMDFARWLEPEWLAALDIDPASLLVGGDLAVNGRAITDCPHESLQPVEWVVRDQHRAAIWLRGEKYPSYWDWSVDT